MDKQWLLQKFMVDEGNDYQNDLKSMAQQIECLLVENKQGPENHHIEEFTNNDDAVIQKNYLLEKEKKNKMMQRIRRQSQKDEMDEYQRQPGGQEVNYGNDEHYVSRQDYYQDNYDHDYNRNLEIINNYVEQNQVDIGNTQYQNDQENEDQSNPNYKNPVEYFNNKEIESLMKNLYSQKKRINQIRLFTIFIKAISYLKNSSKVWYYLDPQGNIQGPFHSLEMNQWNLDQYLYKDLKISFLQNRVFNSLYELYTDPIKIIQSTYSVNAQNLRKISKYYINYSDDQQDQQQRQQSVHSQSQHGQQIEQYQMDQQKQDDSMQNSQIMSNNNYQPQQMQYNQHPYQNENMQQMNDNMQQMDEWQQRWPEQSESTYNSVYIDQLNPINLPSITDLKIPQEYEVQMANIDQKLDIMQQLYIQSTQKKNQKHNNKMQNHASNFNQQVTHL